MDQETCTLDQKEEKIRRNWLLITVFYFLFFPSSCFVFSAGLLLSKSQMYRAVNDALSSFFIFGFIFLWPIWHCAYKKHGTMLLTCCLASIPYQLCSFVLTSCVCKCSSEDDFWLLVVYSVMYILWCISSIRLKKINKKIQVWKIQNEMENCLEYIQSLESLKAALNIEDLNNLFYETIQSWPRFEKFTSIEYRLARSKIHE